MNKYSPRRQSKRWLDGDCPRGVLAIYYDKREPSDPYTIFYAEPFRADESREHSYANTWIQYAGISEYGMGYHGEMAAYKVAEFRFRNSHRAKKWSELPQAVRDWVIADLKAMEET